MKIRHLPLWLSFNGGYVDTAGFLALQGLFAAHVTGNFVTLGATLATGTAGVLPKLLALPVFCAVVLATRLASTELGKRSFAAVRPLLAVKVVLLAVAAVYAVAHGPFSEAGSAATLGMGMTLVAAMAIQNAVHRTHLPKSPPSTLMTGTTTQIMIDLADMILGPSGAPAVTAQRLQRMILNVVVFALGCAAAAGAFILAGNWCFALPPVVAVIAVAARPGEDD
ncbi:MAG: DUF1275 family protein [Ancalomicrobiaceae bacterium]|nr:DUF1275 family protein [Ancalomicrobiaceae bacterium]